MKHPIIITSSGKTAVFDPIVAWNNLPLSQIHKEISGWNLTATKLIMSEADYQDIVAWDNLKYSK